MGLNQDETDRYLKCAQTIAKSIMDDTTLDAKRRSENQELKELNSSLNKIKILNKSEEISVIFNQAQQVFDAKFKKMEHLDKAINLRKFDKWRKDILDLKRRELDFVIDSIARIELMKEKYNDLISQVQEDKPKYQLDQTQ